MPIYEYQCGECGIHFEKLQKFSDPDPDTCPNGHKMVHRRLSQPTIIFKGKGFYVTDNGRNGRHKSTPNKAAGQATAATAKASKQEQESGGGGENKGSQDAKEAG
jgi:putative FmdB family regulatory protein